MKRTYWSDDVGTGWILPLIMSLFVAAATSPTHGEDWGAYALIPASAPTLVLEAVGSGTNEGTVIAIARPAGTPNQKWVITAKGNNLYSIRPAYFYCHCF